MCVQRSLLVLCWVTGILYPLLLSLYLYRVAGSLRLLWSWSKGVVALGCLPSLLSAFSGVAGSLSP